MTQTLAGRCTSRSVKKPPLASGQLRDDRIVGADAEHVARAAVGVAVDDLACAPTSGVLARTEGHSSADGVGVARR